MTRGRAFWLFLLIGSAGALCDHGEECPAKDNALLQMRGELKTMDADRHVAQTKSTWEHCANEGGSCTCSGRVRYGSEPGTYSISRWEERTASGSIGCNNGVWGDPTPGYPKTCECEVSRCACENPGHGTFASCTSDRNCNCNGYVRMGYGNRWTSWRDVSGSIQCTNGAFGGDPAPGQAKECVCNAAPEVNFIGAHATGLGLCEGDCDDDNDCEGSLVCLQRHGAGGAAVPGCLSTDSHPLNNEDYCVTA
jgi:hypothetical protein